MKRLEESEVLAPSKHLEAFIENILGRNVYRSAKGRRTLDR